MKKLTDLRPCDACGGAVGLTFYVIRVSLAIVNPRAVNEFMGIAAFFGGNAGAALIENFAPAAADAVTVAGDREPALMTELAICQDCYTLGPLDLALIAERLQERRARAATASARQEPERAQEVSDPNA